MGGEDGGGGQATGFGAEDGSAQMGQGNGSLPEKPAFGVTPAPFRSETEAKGRFFGDHLGGEQMAERSAGFVGIEGHPDFVLGKGDLLETGGMPNLRQTGMKSLCGTGDQALFPLPGSPERAVGITGFAFFRLEKNDFTDGQSGRFLQDFPAGLRTGQADHPGDGQGRAYRLPGRKDDFQQVSFPTQQGGFAPGSSADSGIESIAGFPAQNGEDVAGSFILAGKKKFLPGFRKEHDIHRSVRLFVEKQA